MAAERADDLNQSKAETEEHLCEFCKVLELALETVYNDCIDTTPPRERYIKVHSRNTQKRTFVKIVYSCGDRKTKEFDARIVKMRKLLNSAESYFGTCLNQEEASIRISFPSGS